jgi:DNA (cytosine-5)-methyltransferase 1
MRPRQKERAQGSAKDTPARFLAVDFFCGAGGTTCGLIDAGGYVLAGVDKDASVRDTYQRNNRNRRLDKSFPEFLNLDIFEASPEYPEGQQSQLFDALSNLIANARVESPNLPLMFAICAPCQPFTTISKNAMTAGRQEKRSRDRGLLTQAAEFVRVFEPDFVLSENVAGISDPVYGGVWQEFEAMLEAFGYDTGSKVVDAVNFQVPQYRKRSILLAVKRKNRRKKSESTRRLVVPSAHPRSRQISVSETIAHLPRIGAGQQHPEIANHKTRSLSALNKQRIQVSKPGESNACLENSKFGDLSLPCHRRVNAKFKQRCFNDVYTRMHPDKPSPTITTKCHSISNGRFGHYDRRQYRGISLREAAALQTFPDRYIFHPEDKIGIVARMIGNAVPPKLAKFFANYLVSGAAERSAIVQED